MKVAVVYITKTNPTPPTQINHEHNVIQNIIQPTKGVLVEREFCKAPRGCELLESGHCPTSVVEKFWE